MSEPETQELLTAEHIELAAPEEWEKMWAQLDPTRARRIRVVNKHGGGPRYEAFQTKVAQLPAEDEDADQELLYSIDLFEPLAPQHVLAAVHQIAMNAARNYRTSGGATPADVVMTIDVFGSDGVIIGQVVKRLDLKEDEPAVVTSVDSGSGSSGFVTVEYFTQFVDRRFAALEGVLMQISGRELPPSPNREEKPPQQSEAAVRALVRESVKRGEAEAARKFMTALADVDDDDDLSPAKSALLAKMPEVARELGAGIGESASKVVDDLLSSFLQP